MRSLSILLALAVCLYFVIATPLPIPAQVEQGQAGQGATLAAQKEAVIQAIGAKDIERANDQCNQMLSRFASDEGLAQAAYDIAVAYGDAGS